MARHFLGGALHASAVLLNCGRSHCGLRTLDVDLFSGSIRSRWAFLKSCWFALVSPRQFDAVLCSFYSLRSSEAAAGGKIISRKIGWRTTDREGSVGRREYRSRFGSRCLEKHCCIDSHVVVLSRSRALFYSSYLCF